MSETVPTDLQQKQNNRRLTQERQNLADESKSFRDFNDDSSMHGSSFEVTYGQNNSKRLTPPGGGNNNRFNQKENLKMNVDVKKKLSLLNKINKRNQAVRGSELIKQDDGNNSNSDLKNSNEGNNNHNNTLHPIQQNEGKLPVLNNLRRRLVNHGEEKGVENGETPESKERQTSSQFNLKSNINTYYLSKKNIINGRDDNTSESGILRSYTSHRNEEEHTSKLHDIVHSYSEQLKSIRKSPMVRYQHPRHYQPPLRRVAEGMPEVHFIGEIRKGFSYSPSFSSPFHYSSSSAISCKWKVEQGQSFSHLAGEVSGQTQYAMIHDDNKECIWNHPIDIHFAAASLIGWPRIIIQLWELDKYGRSLLVGFGFAHLPCSKGTHKVTVQCWKPRVSSFIDQISSFFLGSSTHLKSDAIIFDEAWRQRHRIHTSYVGQVSIHLTTILRYFEDS